MNTFTYEWIANNIVFVPFLGDFLSIESVG